MAGTKPSDSNAATTETATLGGGCFWCTEAVFSALRGVDSVVPGYSGGQLDHPSYEQVCTGRTGHAEVVQVVFRPAEISYHDLLSVFFATHDPTTKDRQGPDRGPQYRSVVFAHGPAQAETARAVLREVEQARLYPGPLVTEVVEFRAFFPAEEYHRDYFARHPEQAYCQMVIAPKVAKFRKAFTDRLRRA